MSGRIGEKACRRMFVGQLKAMGEYVIDHAEDFVARADSDETMLADGLDVTLHIRCVDQVPTIEVRREVFVPKAFGGSD